MMHISVLVLSDASDQDLYAYNVYVVIHTGCWGW